MGSKSDMERWRRPARSSTERGIRYEIRVMSAHRHPDVVADYCRNARMRGLSVIIAGAGSVGRAARRRRRAHRPAGHRRAALQPAVRARRARRVLSIVQMPPGVPVAAVGLDNAKNAGHLAARILASAPHG